MARPLFILGPARSGTTALLEYLNLHEEILICKERYKYMQKGLDPDLLTFQRILDYGPQDEGGETNIPREYHEELLAKKDPGKLSWIGDKLPSSPWRFKMIYENNPGVRFLATYRPLEEVVESFVERTKNPDDRWLGGKDGLEMGVNAWNRAMRSVRDFVKNEKHPRVFVVSYEDFFQHNRECAPLVFDFLGLDRDDELLEEWAGISHEFEGGRREKDQFSREQMDFLEENKDHEAEAWVLDRIERQKRAPEVYVRESANEGRELATAAVSEKTEARTQDKKIERLENRIENLQGNLRIAQRRAAELEREPIELRKSPSSKSPRVASTLRHVRARIRGGR